MAFAILAAPLAQAQSDGSGYSVHSKTPAENPPASAEPPAEADPAEPASEAAAPQQAPAEGDPAATAEGAAPAEAPAEAEPEAGAQTAAQPGEESNPLGVSSGWDAQFGTTPPQTSRFTGSPEQVEIVEKVNAYFNTMTNLEGLFLQTDANDERKKGKFFLERPGKVLFDYARPSRMKIISDGEYLAIENHDLRTSDRYPLESTPFRLLLKEKVNLVQDARIIAIDQGESIVVLTVEDKESRGGQIRLFFDSPDLQLREWIITDAQGLNTRIELAELENDKEADPKLFEFSKDIGLPNFKGSGN
jgi:outer membrane lipoprotein-sorting protein